MFKGGLNARLNALGVAPPKMEKGPKSAPKFFSDSFQFLAELRVLQPPLCIKKPLCEAVLRVLAGSCTQNSTPFHIFSFFMKTHNDTSFIEALPVRFEAQQFENYRNLQWNNIRYSPDQWQPVRHLYCLNSYHSLLKHCYTLLHTIQHPGVHRALA